MKVKKISQRLIFLLIVLLTIVNILPINFTAFALEKNDFARGSNLIFVQMETLPSGNNTVVTSAKELCDAFENAVDGDVITLGANIDYDQSILGTIIVTKKVTLDCNGYKISVDDALFQIGIDKDNPAGELTIVKARIESIYDDVIDYVYGTLIIESTYGEGIITDYNFISYNYGKVIVKGGKFDLYNSLIYENYDNAEVIIENADMTSECYIVGYLNNSGCSLVIKDGTYTVDSSIVSGVYNGNVIIENGIFTSDDDIFDDIEGGNIVIENGTFNVDWGIFDEIEDGNFLIKNGTFYSRRYMLDDIEGGNVVIEKGIFTSTESCLGYLSGGTLTVKDGIFTSGDENNDCCVFELYDDSTLNIEGGVFTSTDNTIYAAYNAVVNLSGGHFINTSEEAAFYIEDDAKINIADGYRALPDDREVTNASEVKIVSLEITVTYISEGVEHASVYDKPVNQIFPTNPTHSEGYDFVYWENNKGDHIEDLTVLKEDTMLYAVFSDRTYIVTFYDKGIYTKETVVSSTEFNKVPGINRTDNGDGFAAWKLGSTIIDSDTTDRIYSDKFLVAIYSEMVMDYDQLVTAIDNKKEYILLGADIEVKGTIEVDYECIIDGNFFGLIRPEGFEGALLTTKEGVTGGGGPGGVGTDGVVLTARNLFIDGSNLDAKSSAVYVSANTTLNMDNVIIKNNKTNMVSWNYRNEPYYCEGNGGAIYIEDEASVLLTNCTIQDNLSSNMGGGIYGNNTLDEAMNLTLNDCKILNNTSVTNYGRGGGGICVEGFAKVDITNCLIDGNTSNSYGGGLAFGYCFNEDDETTVVNITDSIISNNTANDAGALELTHSIVHLYGTTSLEYNKAAGDGGAIHSQNGGNDDDTIIYMHDSSSMSYNEADGDGGAVYLWEQLLVMNDNSSIHHNKAGENGGAVYAGCYGVRQNGGVIRDNYAGEKGGGVYGSYQYNNFVTGMMYDNIAEEAGDDIYKDWNSWIGLYPSQPDRLYGDGDSINLMTVDVEPITGYYEVPINEISVPYFGWFIDGVYVAERVPAPWNPNVYITVYNLVEGSRYKNRIESELVCQENDNLDFLTDGKTYTGGKAIWYGLLLAYDANCPESSDHQYDKQAYSQNTNATVLDNMFTRPGYVFTGWNTSADGTGTAYNKDDELLMDKSQVLYAQWEKIYSVTYQVIGDSIYGNPDNSVTPIDGKEYKYNELVTVDDNLSTTQNNVEVDDGKIPGTWEFSGWSTEDFHITADTTITGSWKFTPDTYKVTYEVADDATYGSPEGITIPTDNTAYGWKASVEVATALSSDQVYAKVGTENVPGKWTFSGWDHDTGFAITKDTVIKGSWTFTPETIDVKVIKVWNDNNSVDRPEYVEVQLYRDGVAYGDIITLDNNNGWTYTWTDLANNRVWTVDEVGVLDGYEKTIAENTNIWTIINTKPEPMPDTGDNINVTLVLVIMFLSGIGSLGLTIYGKKKRII